MSLNQKNLNSPSSQSSIPRGKKKQREFIEQVVQEVLQVNPLAAIVENPRQSLASLPLLNPEEEYQLLEGWNETKADYSLTEEFRGFCQGINFRILCDCLTNIERSL